ncbi:hypothetical protein N7509_009701 [Penicillium cosmopolitanum]|uniref:Uncharacterized protein n=1 Tax=Penicillium cosmopolitanum TaxID=1131564 RepID=A0A9W9VQ37_9EURO|nr:uncharacterized protein N7509_009701 [Penicillium cosmopolitanum]KAJ5387160.1 hypothetical protein N7509_009701 [Penicillium cosmopolitanum]
MSAWYTRPLEWIYLRRGKTKKRSYHQRVRERERELRRAHNGEATCDKKMYFEPFGRRRPRMT